MLKIKTLLVLLCSFLMIGVQAQTTIVKGLTVMVAFSDVPFNVSVDSVADMMNQPGFAAWGNKGSVRDFFLTQSVGKLDVSSKVIKVTLPHPHSHYTTGGGRDLSDIIDQINIGYPAGFQNLTIDPDGSVKHFHILTRAGGGAWAFKEQAGSKIIKNNGVDVKVIKGNITNYDISAFPYISTICHEMGHSFLLWPDYYQTGWSNLGSYSVMANGGENGVPMDFGPGLRFQKGWIDNVIEVGATTQTYTAVSNSYTTVYKYTNPYNPKEYLLIHPQVYDNGYYKQRPGVNNVPDQGLAIYYVDTDGTLDVTGVDPSHFINLVTADNLDEMHDEARAPFDIFGDLDDLFDNQTSTFNSSNSIFKWKDGGDFGLHITNISAPGATMTFTVNAAPSKFIVTSDKNGTISPSGVIGAAAGATQTFTLNPYPGYEIDQLKVNGLATTVTGNTYTTTGSGTKRIEVTYKRKATLDPLPLPWLHSDLGTAPVTGVSGQVSGKFYLESYGSDIGENSDNFRFVYQKIVGDGSIEGKLTFSNKPKDKSKAGFMIRESLTANSAFSMIMYTPREYTRVHQRTNTGGFVVENPDGVGELHKYSLYKWFKITRQGNQISSYCSRDRVNWFLMAQETITMGAEVYVGLAVSGGLPDFPSRAQFDSITVIKSNVGGCTDPTWNAATAYNGGAKVSYNGRKYTAQWWTQNNQPNLNAGPGLPWIDNGACGTENLTPIVNLTSPSNYSRFRSPANLVLTATASDADGSVSKVEFYNGTTLIGTATASPYTYTWANVPVGTYAITAKVYDNLNATATSAVANVLVNTNSAPVITIDAPVAVNGINPKYIVGGSQTVSAFVSDDEGVEKVVFTLTKTGATFTDYIAPYQATFTNLPAPYADGSLSYTIVATDNEAATSSEIVVVYKNRVPNVFISTPANNANFDTGSNITIGALVSDADWTSGKVEYFNGTTKLGETTTNTVGGSAINFVWSNVANGTYTITAKATDDLGESATSSAITVVVSTPTSTCTAPLYNAATAYNGNAVVQYNGIKYKANWWTQGNQPDLNNGPVGSGKPWTSQGTCTSRLEGQEAIGAATSVYPNPTSGTFTIDTEREATAYISNAYGNEIAVIVLEKGSNEVNLSVPAGVYIVKINNNVTKLIVQ